MITFPICSLFLFQSLASKSQLNRFFSADSLELGFLDVFIGYSGYRVFEKKNASQDFTNALEFSLCLTTHSNRNSLFCDEFPSFLSFSFLALFPKKISI